MKPIQATLLIHDAINIPFASGYYHVRIRRPSVHPLHFPPPQTTQAVAIHNHTLIWNESFTFKAKLNSEIQLTLKQGKHTIGRVFVEVKDGSKRLLLQDTRINSTLLVSVRVDGEGEGEREENGTRDLWGLVVIPEVRKKDGVVAALLKELEEEEEEELENSNYGIRSMYSA